MKKQSLLNQLDEMNTTLGTIDREWICPLDDAGLLVAFSGADHKGYLRLGVAMAVKWKGQDILVPIETETYSSMADLDEYESERLEQDWVNRMYEIYLETENKPEVLMKKYKSEACVFVLRKSIRLVPVKV